MAKPFEDENKMAEDDDDDSNEDEQPSSSVSLLPSLSLCSLSPISIAKLLLPWLTREKSQHFKKHVGILFIFVKPQGCQVDTLKSFTIFTKNQKKNVECLVVVNFTVFA